MKKTFFQKISLRVKSAFKNSGVLLAFLACFSVLLFAAVDEVQAGSLQVTISPSEARNEGARWRRAGTTPWFASSATETGIPDGTYTVEFLDLRYWTESAPQTITVSGSQTATLAVVFSECGDLKVTINPAGAVAAGAQWRRVGTTTWQNSGYIEPNVPVGWNTVEFKTVPGYTKPANASKKINKNKNFGAITATYTQVTTGALTVTLSPAGAVAAGAKWRRIKADGTTTPWFSSGHTETRIPAFTYQIEFLGVTGWVTPARQSVTITAGGSSSASGVYYQEPGTFQTIINPAGATAAGARWSIDAGATWLASGTTLTGLVPGSYTVTYNLLQGWSKPLDQTVTLSAGGAASVTGTYIQLPGTLQVIIDPPEAVSAGAQWSIDAGGSWHASGETLIDLSPGAYTVTFSALSGWTKPADQSVTVSAKAAASVQGSYVLQAGSLLVAIIPPEAVSAGAQWSIDGGATWNNSNVEISGVALGACTIQFKALTGWDTPPEQSVTIEQDNTTSAIGTYVQQLGTLQVLISPEAVVSQAQWSIDGGSTWLYSGETLAGLAAGDYTVTFKAVPGYGTPVDQEIPLAAGDSITVIGYYATTWYQDSDGDGYGNPAAATLSAVQPEGYVLDSTDCDDSDSTVFPGAPETCNAKDDNCNGQADENSGTIWYRDADGDGYGNPAEVMLACTQPEGYVADGSDCDDANAAVHPGAAEVCGNNSDDNCNGQTDEGCDSTTTIPVTTTTAPATTTTTKPATTTITAGSSTTTTVSTTTTIDPECAVKIFPRHISKLLSIIKPIGAFIMWKEDKTAFDVNTRISWEDDAIKTLASFVLGKKKRLLFAIVFIKPRDLVLSSAYTVQVSDCAGKIAIRQF